MNDTLKKMDRKNLVKWICVLLVPILIMLIPVQGVFTPALRTFSAITITAILLFAFGLLPNFIVSLSWTAASAAACAPRNFPTSST